MEYKTVSCHTSLSEVLQSCNDGDTFSGSPYAYSKWQKGGRGLRTRVGGTHLASEVLVEKNVASCQVPVNKRLSRQVCHPGCHLSCKPHKHTLQLTLVRILTVGGPKFINSMIIDKIAVLIYCLNVGIIM